jgi:hypothetical protein
MFGILLRRGAQPHIDVLALLVIIVYGLATSLTHPSVDRARLLLAHSDYYLPSRRRSGGRPQCYELI